MHRSIAFSWRNTGLPYGNFHPVVNVSWNDAVAFCNWLSRKDGKPEHYRIEQSEVTVVNEEGYRLPSEAEWEYACRAGATTAYSCGDDPECLASIANIRDATSREKMPKRGRAILASDDHAFTASAGRFKRNAFGLFDMHGNVWEWCQDRHDVYYYSTSPDVDPAGPASGSQRVYRGGGWINPAEQCRCATRFGGEPSEQFVTLGFRIARSLTRAESGLYDSYKPVNDNGKLPRERTGLRCREEGDRAGEERHDNGLEMKLVWCPSGKFRMGSPPSEEQRGDHEGPVEVNLRQGFWIGKYEVTQWEWDRVMNSEPWQGAPSARCRRKSAASHLDWDKATDFCDRLTRGELDSGRLPRNWQYALPTEAQWEYACRAGTTTRYSFGDDKAQLDDYGWYGGLFGIGSAQSEKWVHQVGLKKPNSWNLFDMHGNLYELCRDSYAEVLPGGSDPLTSNAGADVERVIRGGGWASSATGCRSANRVAVDANMLGGDFGLRVVLCPIR